MRDIRFRAWDLDFKKMLMVHEATFVNGIMIGAKGVNWDSKVIVMQYTGLKDKNGKEIYEGDIIYRKRPGTFKSEPDREEKEVVTWNENKCAFCGDEGSTSIWFYVVENPIPYYVIGNIYENKELLTED